MALRPSPCQGYRQVGGWKWSGSLTTLQNLAIGSVLRGSAELPLLSLPPRHPEAPFGKWVPRVGGISQSEAWCMTSLPPFPQEDYHKLLTKYAGPRTPSTSCASGQGTGPGRVEEWRGWRVRGVGLPQNDAFPSHCLLSPETRELWDGRGPSLFYHGVTL